MSREIDDHTDKIKKLRQQLMAEAERMRRRVKTALQGEEQRLLEYFWQPQLGTTRESLTLNEIVFLESDARGLSGMHSMIRADLTRPLGALVNKGYLSIHSDGGDAVYRLDVLGVRYMTQEHPDTVAIMQKLIDWLVGRPLYVLLGLVASLLTIAGAISAVAAWMLKG